MMNRTPPPDVRKLLRQEVNFQCPVDGCNHPYLTYHHFKPKWNLTNHHNPEGMIALCAHHHHAADNGAYTDAQLEGFKSSFNNNDLISGKFEWKRNSILLMAGGNWYLNPKEIAIKHQNKMLIKINSQANEYNYINIQKFNSKGDITFQMKENSWLVYQRLEDLVSPPGGKDLRISSLDGFKLHLSFEDLSFSSFENRYKNGMSDLIYNILIARLKGIDESLFIKYFEELSNTENNIHEVDNNDTITLLKLHFSIQQPVKVALTEKYILVDNKPASFKGNLMEGNINIQV